MVSTPLCMVGFRDSSFSEKYSFSLFGSVGTVVNNSELAYGKRYKYRFSFQVELFCVYPLDIKCQCEKMPEKLKLVGEAVLK